MTYPVFYELVTQGYIANETCLNVFTYSDLVCADAYAHAVQAQDLADTWVSAILPAWLAVMDNDYHFTSVVVRGFNANGAAGFFSPVTSGTPDVGGTGIATKGANLGFIIRKRLLQANTISHGGTPPRRGYWFLSPVDLTYVDEAGTFTPASTYSTHINTLLAALDDVVAGAVANFTPVVLSHTTSAHALVTDVTAYSVITATALGPRTKTRNSRQNNR